MSGTALLQSISNGISVNKEKDAFKTAPNYGVPNEPNDPDFDSLFSIKEDMQNQTLLHNRYVFYCLKRTKNSSNYEEGVKKISSFQTVEHFWYVYDHIIRPNDQKSTIDYHLFKNGIKPTWEDPNNENGGKWMVRLKKGLASTYWEELVLAIIGEQFDVGNEICGAVVSVRSNEDIISVWNKTADNTEAKDKIRDQLRRVLKLPAFVPLEYKKHHDSLNDKSSFRNTVVWRPPPGKLERGAEGGGGAFNKGFGKGKGGTGGAGGTGLGGTGAPGAGGKSYGSDRGKSSGAAGDGAVKHPRAAWLIDSKPSDEKAEVSGSSWGFSRREESASSASGWGRSKNNNDHHADGGARAVSGDGVARPGPTTLGIISKQSTTTGSFSTSTSTSSNIPSPTVAPLCNTEPGIPKSDGVWNKIPKADGSVWGRNLKSSES